MNAADQIYYDTMMGAQQQQDQTAPFPVQLARGVVSGATFGGIRPFADAGTAGWPETFANLAGGALAFSPLSRLAGLGVAGLGRFAPQVLAEGVPAATAAAKMFTRFKPLQEALSPMGRKIAMGATGLGMAEGPEIVGQEPRTIPERLIGALAGMGLGVAGESLAQRLGGSVAPPSAAQEASRVVGEVAAGGPHAPSPFAATLKTNIAKAQTRIETHQELLSQYPRTEQYKGARANLEKLIDADQRKIQSFQSKLDMLPIAPTQAGVQAAAQAPARAIPDLVQAMTPDQLKMTLQQKGISAIGVPEDRMRELVTDALSQKALPPGSQLTQMLGAETPPQPTVFTREAPPLVGRQMRDPGTGQMLPGPTRETLYPPGKAPAQLYTELTANMQKRLKQMNLTPLIPSKYEGEGAFNAMVMHPEAVGQAVQRLRIGGGGDLPPTMDAAARLADDAVFPNARYPELISSDPKQRRKDLTHLLASGYSESSTVKWLSQKIGILPSTWRYAGTVLEPLPYMMEEGNRIKDHVLDGLWRESQPFMNWTSQTKAIVQRRFFEYASRPPAELDAVIRKEAPEAVAALPQYREIMNRIWADYVDDGALAPEKYFTNYLPVVRETRSVMAPGKLMIEKGEYYVPREIKNLVGSYDPVFTRERLFTNPEDFPRKIGFDDTVKLYYQQYARHVSVRELEPRINELLAKVDDPDLAKYAADHVNNWLGKANPGDRRLGDLTSMIRSYNFARDLGWNLLSPLVNTMQRINTFAVVRPSAFTKAFADRLDPERMALAARVLGHDVVAKAGIDEAPVNPTTLSGWAAKLAQSSGKMFSMSERGNRVHAFLSGLREAEARGIQDLDTRVAFADRLVSDTQFIMSLSGIPIFRGGNIGRMMGQFQSYRLNQIHFMTRLVDEAQQGMTNALKGENVSEELRRVFPLIKFLGASVALGGGSSVLFGDIGEEKASRALLGRAMRIPGLPEQLFGVSLASQMGLGGIGADDINSFMFYLPGPTLTYLQGLMSLVTGVDLGHGVQTDQNTGQLLSFDQRVRLLAQAFPGGLQINRALQGFRLLANHGEYREALDWGEAAGMKPGTGHLSSEAVAKTGQALAAIAGLPLGARQHEQRSMERIANLTDDYKVYSGRAGKLLASGREDEAFREMKKFYHKYSDQLRFQPPISDQSLESQALAHMLPPLKRTYPPEWALGSEPYESTPSILDLISPPGRR